MQLCKMAEFRKRSGFPSATLVAGKFSIRWQYLITYSFIILYIVQLYKEDWAFLRMLGLSGHSSPQYRVNSLVSPKTQMTRQTEFQHEVANCCISRSLSKGRDTNISSVSQYSAIKAPYF